MHEIKLAHNGFKNVDESRFSDISLGWPNVFWSLKNCNDSSPCLRTLAWKQTFLMIQLLSLSFISLSDCRRRLTSCLRERVLGQN